MILGSNHWLFTEKTIASLLPYELWVMVFQVLHDARIKDLDSKFTRGYHNPEETVLLGNSDDDGYPYLQSYFSNGYLVQTHFHRIITAEIRPDLDMRRLGYTLGKMHDIQTKLYENRDDPMTVRWLTARIELFKKDIFKTNIISHCFTYDLAGGGLELVRMNYHFVWGEERSNKGSIFFYFSLLINAVCIL